PGDAAVGRGRAGRVPHPRGRLDRARPAAPGALPGRRAGRPAGVPDRHGGHRPVVRRRGRRLGRPLVHPGQPGPSVVRGRGAGPGYAKALAARLDEGRETARLWVPAARDRADAFGPDADVRGAADLPVLIVAGDLAAAVGDLIGDLADAVVDTGEAVADGSRPAVPLADRSVALLNRGTPGGVVTPHGTLHLSRMR